METSPMVSLTVSEKMKRASIKQAVQEIFSRNMRQMKDLENKNSSFN